MIQTWYTYAVRICIVAWFIMFMQHIILGWSFLTIQQYDDVFHILQQSITDITYISRVIIAWLSLGVWNLSQMLYALLDQMYIWDIICIVSFIFVFPLLQTKYLYRIGYSILIMYIGCIIVFIFGMQSLSLSGAIIYMRIIGGIIILMSSIICYFLVRLWRNYEKGLY